MISHESKRKCFLPDFITIHPILVKIFHSDSFSFMVAQKEKSETLDSGFINGKMNVSTKCGSNESCT